MSTLRSVLLFIVLVAICELASAAQAPTAKYPSCNSGKATLKMTNVDKQPALCTTQGIANLTLPCLRTITMTVKGCDVLQNSSVFKSEAGFPCHAVYFTGAMTAPNAASLMGQLATTQEAATDVTSFCLQNIDACSSLQSYKSVPVTVWRELDTLYVAASPSCTYTYAVSTADSDLFAGSSVTPTGVSKTSKRDGSGLSITSPTVANNTKAPNNTAPSPSDKKRNNAGQLASSTALVVLAALAAVLV